VAKPKKSPSKSKKSSKDVGAVEEEEVQEDWILNCVSRRFPSSFSLESTQN